IQMPGQEQPYFSLTTTYTPKNRQNLISFMAVNADVRSDDYGQIRALRVSSNTQIDGPGQVANAFETDPQVATELSLLRQGDAETRPGNLLPHPVGGGLLYVQPIYVVRASGDAAYPLLRRVLVQFGDEIGYAPSLQEALDQIFRGESGAETEEEGRLEDGLPPEGEGDTPPDQETPPEGEGQSPPPGEEPTTPPTQEPPAGNLEEAIAEVDDAFKDAQQAQAEGRWADYGAALDRLE